MSLSFKFIPLTFLSDENEIKKQIRNTIILKYFFERNSETVHLEDLITGTQYGYNASSLVHGRNKFLRISDITDGKVNWETVPYCNCTDEATYLLFPNDILIARTGGTTGKSFLISEPPALSIYAGYLIRIRANEDTNPNYLNLFLNSYVYWSQIVSLNEDSFRPSVNANSLKKLILPKCDLETQNNAVKISNGELIKGYDYLYQLINETLLKYDKLIEIQAERRNQINLHKILKQSILREAIHGELTSSWRNKNKNTESASKLFENITNEKIQLIKDKKIKKEKDLLPFKLNEVPFDLPKNWKWCFLGDICTKVTDGFHHTPQKINEGKIYVSPKHLKNNKIDWKSCDYILNADHIYLTKKTTPKKGEILIANRGTIGEATIIDIDEEFSFQNLALIGFNQSFINSKYVFYYIQFKRQDILDFFANGGLQPMLSNKILKTLPFPLAPIEEQKVIVQKIESLIKNCESLENEFINSKKQTYNLMQAVLKEAFEIKKESSNLDLFFDDINYNLYVAMIHKQIESRLRINYGEVATQKTVFNINAFTDQKIPYNFINSNHGTFSPQLKEDIGKNDYLTKDRKGNGEVFIIKPSKEKEVLDALSNPKNKDFVRGINKVLDIYEMSFINKETDKIELLNTVAKLIIDTKSTDLEIIYNGMQKWQIKQNGFKTKAEKFSKTDTKKMISLIENLGLVEKLKKFA